MKIAIVTGGTRGDVQPYVALGSGLRAAGAAVRVLASDDFADLVRGAGLEFASTGFSIQQLLQSDAWRGATERGNFLTVAAAMRREMGVRAREMAPRIPPLLEGADLVLAGVAGLSGGFAAAEKLGLPFIQAYLLPHTPTAAFASPIAPRDSLGGPLNRLSHRALRQILWQSGRAADVVTRQVLGLPRGSLWGPFREYQRRGIPVLYGYSRHVLPPPPDWDRHHHVTGYWFLDEPAGWEPPAALQAFLDAGPPPVYVGYGSMGSRNPRALAEQALAALEQAGVRGILAAGWGGLDAADLPSSVQMIQSVPHSWLFPRLAAVVHHGGAGTTAAGLRAGVPSIIVPFFGDQPYWGRRVAALGVGPAPLSRRRLTADRLADAIRRTLDDGDLARRAAALGERIRAEDGVGDAVKLVRVYTPSARSASSF